MLNIVVDKLLPVDEVREASCLETREKVQICTGEKLHCFKMGDTLMISNELYQKFIAEQSDPKG